MKRSTSDACEILEKLFGPFDEEEYQKERERCLIGCQIYAARKARGLSQRKLAEMVGTTASAICRLENADYDRYSVPTLRKIADALGMRLEVRLVEETVVQ